MSPRKKRGAEDVVILTLSPRLKTLLGVTAALFEMSIESYLQLILERHASAIEAQFPRRRLSPRAMRALVAGDPKPNAALRKAARSRRRFLAGPRW